MGEALRAICGGPIGLRVAGAFDGYLLEIDSIDSLGFCFTEASCGSRSKLVQQSRYNEYEVMLRSVGIA